MLTRFLLFFTLWWYFNISAISIVYNFRIAQITKQPIFDKEKRNAHTIVALAFDQYQKKYDATQQNFLGGFASYIYVSEPYYIRTDWAISNIKEHSCGLTTFSGTQVDDILFTAGRNFLIHDKSVMTLSGMFGLPTHKLYRLQHVDFGYSQVGLGAQLDGSYNFSPEHILLYGARYIYFVPRNAVDDLCKHYKFTIGNIGDILVAYKYSRNKHGFEIGYTFRAQFRAHIFPHLDEIVQKTDYLRNNFYFVYKYKFKINQVSNRLLFNISYGFDQKPKTFGNKEIITFWVSWNIGF